MHFDEDDPNFDAERKTESYPLAESLLDAEDVNGAEDYTEAEDLNEAKDFNEAENFNVTNDFNENEGFNETEDVNKAEDFNDTEDFNEHDNIKNCEGLNDADDFNEHEDDGEIFEGSAGLQDGSERLQDENGLDVAESMALKFDETQDSVVVDEDLSSEDSNKADQCSEAMDRKKSSNETKFAKNYDDNSMADHEDRSGGVASDDNIKSGVLEDETVVIELNNKENLHMIEEVDNAENVELVKDNGGVNEDAGSTNGKRYWNDHLKDRMRNKGRSEALIGNSVRLFEDGKKKRDDTIDLARTAGVLKNENNEAMNKSSKWTLNRKGKIMKKSRSEQVFRTAAHELDQGKKSDDVWSKDRKHRMLKNSTMNTQSKALAAFQGKRKLSKVPGSLKLQQDNDDQEKLLSRNASSQQLLHRMKKNNWSEDMKQKMIQASLQMGVANSIDEFAPMTSFNNPSKVVTSKHQLGASLPPKRNMTIQPRQRKASIQPQRNMSIQAQHSAPNPSGQDSSPTATNRNLWSSNLRKKLLEQTQLHGIPADEKLDTITSQAAPSLSQNLLKSHSKASMSPSRQCTHHKTVPSPKHSKRRHHREYYSESSSSDNDKSRSYRKHHKSPSKQRYSESDDASSIASTSSRYSRKSRQKTSRRSPSKSHSSISKKASHSKSRHLASRHSPSRKSPVRHSRSRYSPSESQNSESLYSPSEMEYSPSKANPSKSQRKRAHPSTTSRHPKASNARYKELPLKKRANDSSSEEDAASLDSLDSIHALQQNPETSDFEKRVAQYYTMPDSSNAHIEKSQLIDEAITILLAA